MTNDDTATAKPVQTTAGSSEEAPRPLTPAAARALAEAEARRKARDEADARSLRVKEYGGQLGPEPTRYGDWEKSGIVSDF